MLKRLVITVVVGAISPCAVAAERTAVLIVSATSVVTSLDAHDARLLFLGHPVRVAGHVLVPLRNLSDARLEQVFLQNLVAMTSTGYDRYVLRLALQQGRPRPREFGDSGALLAALTVSPLAVTYTWDSEIRGNPDVRIVRVLWRE
ncbi:MAG TPA: hypothetical protein P5528_16100 [Steroidobacteraceae bacterium]|nr:hypothetical protein [Steroidobacteraceae bacterium]HRX90963.1 hypothetical protein [Steroidobacteraceae bacterium]